MASSRVDSFGGERRSLTGAAHISTYDFGGSSSDEADEDAAFLYTSVDARRNRALLKKRLCYGSVLAVGCACVALVVHARSSSPASAPVQRHDDVAAETSTPIEHNMTLQAPRPTPSPAPLRSSAVADGHSRRRENPDQTTDGEAVATGGRGFTFFCFMVVLPFGYELDLLKEQYQRGVSIFSCDHHAVFSNDSFPLGGHGSEATVAFEGDMRVRMNTWTWEKYGVKLALNTEVFLRVWRKLWTLDVWRNCDWIVKTEADTVFFPIRLQELLRLQAATPPEPSGEQPARGDETCGNCSAKGLEHDTCTSHVRWVQQQGTSCAKALDDVERQPPVDCGCTCNVDTCKSPYSVYLRNCAHNYYEPKQRDANKALHGPLEVLSIEAAKLLQGGLRDCEDVFHDSFGQWGEDWFLEHCLLWLGVNPVDSFHSLADGDCNPHGTYDGSCRYSAAAFQPKKTVQDYFDCLNEAERDGRWPPADWRRPPF